MRRLPAPALCLCLTLAVLLAGGLGCAETPAPVPAPAPVPVPIPAPGPVAPTAGVPATPAAGEVQVEIFADDSDAPTAAWLKAQTDALAKTFAADKVKWRVLNPSAKENYARLHAFETAAGLKQFAAVEAFLTPIYDYVGPDNPGMTDTTPQRALAVDAAGFLEPYGHPLALVGQDAIAAQLQPAIHALLTPHKGLLSAQKPELLKAAAERLLKTVDWQLQLPADFPGVLDPHRTGVVKTWNPQFPPGDEPPPQVDLTLLYLPIDCPVCSDTELVVLRVLGKIHAIEPIRPMEKSGVPIPAEAQKFLDQFKAKTLDGTLSKQIAGVDGISGATKTAANVKALLIALDEELQKDHHPAPAPAPASVP